MIERPAGARLKAALRTSLCALPAVLTLHLPPDPAGAADRCTTYGDAVRMLARRHGEHLFDTAKGRAPGTSFELWLNTETGSFTILIRSGAAACFVRAGRLDPARLRTDRGDTPT